VGPVFLNDTVNAERYLKLLQDHFVHILQGMGVNMEETFFQQDGARTQNAVLKNLSEHIHDSGHLQSISRTILNCVLDPVLAGFESL
jgi:hypothetical protein